MPHFGKLYLSHHPKIFTHCYLHPTQGYTTQSGALWCISLDLVFDSTWTVLCRMTCKILRVVPGNWL